VKAVVWHGKEKLSVDEVPDPALHEPTDAIVRITSTAICGSDLHLYSKFMRPAMRDGDILGHEPMGIVDAVGSDVKQIRPGDRVVVPFNIACGACFMCGLGLQSQCETTQNRKWGKGASLFGYTHLYGAVPGGQAEYLRVPQAHYGPIKCRKGRPTSASSSCRTSSRRHGKPWRTRPFRRVEPSASGGSARSGRCARESRFTVARGV
jgi:threonine dehydrogenase-like Zn-dependent dehydrogenase